MDNTGHSVDGCGKNSNCMSWLRLFCRSVIQILLIYLIGFKKDSKQIMFQIKALGSTDTATWDDEFVKIYIN